MRIAHREDSGSSPELRGVVGLWCVARPTSGSFALAQHKGRAPFDSHSTGSGRRLGIAAERLAAELSSP